jgi:hypothetical protein
MTPLKESPLSVSGLREVLQRGRPCSMIRGVATDRIRLLPRPRGLRRDGLYGTHETNGSRKFHESHRSHSYFQAARCGNWA